MFSDCNHMILLSLLSRNTRSAIFRFTPCRTTSRTPALTHTLYRSMPKKWTFHIVCSDCDSRAQHHTPCEHSCKCDWYFAHFFLPLFTRAKRILSHSSVKFNVQKQQMIGLIERQLGRVSCSACVVKRSPHVAHTHRHLIAFSHNSCEIFPADSCEVYARLYV